MANYEYKCVSGPRQLVVKSASESAKAISEYANIINVEAVDGWNFSHLRV